MDEELKLELDVPEVVDTKEGDTTEAPLLEFPADFY